MKIKGMSSERPHGKKWSATHAQDISELIEFGLSYVSGSKVATPSACHALVVCCLRESKSKVEYKVMMKHFILMKVVCFRMILSHPQRKSAH